MAAKKGEEADDDDIKVPIAISNCDKTIGKGVDP